MTKEEEIKKLKKEILQKDLPLRESAKNLVLGKGSLESEILFIGEAPGFWEDQKGEPFAGNSGKLLDKLFLEAGISRDKVFISNVVMYRPPNNRDPLPTELAAFDPYIKRLISIIGPSLIVTLGRFSMQKFLTNVKISEVHGKLYKREVEGRTIYVMPMFHPAAALRRVEIMNMIKNDFARLPSALRKIKEIQK